MLELCGIGTRKKRLDFQIHPEFFLHATSAAGPVERDLGHAAMRASGADLLRNFQ